MRIYWSFFCKILNIHKFKQSEALWVRPVDKTTGEIVGRPRALRVRVCRRCKGLFSVA